MNNEPCKLSGQPSPKVYLLSDVITEKKYGPPVFCDVDVPPK
jgi:hypothetical protein